jgi:hypothetical protein
MWWIRIFEWDIWKVQLGASNSYELKLEVVEQVQFYIHKNAITFTDKPTPEKWPPT